MFSARQSFKISMVECLFGLGLVWFALVACIHLGLCLTSMFSLLLILISMVILVLITDEKAK